MSDPILDEDAKADVKKGTPFLYTVGSLLILAAFIVFMATKWAVISLIICLLGTISVWVSPKKIIDKIMASIPLVGFIFVLYVYSKLPFF